ncbi:YdhR family protein [Nodosilinea sp. AN01ver1]|uniref:YdhR family protein n=1 Tax=Nodosilinea sp. AN01ver1 TaxID=3423362 RepID=UPI003D318678
MNFAFDAPAEQVKQTGLDLALAIAQVPGLVWKTWLMNEAKREAGGIYWFDSEAAAIAYLNSDIGQHIQHNPTFSAIQIRLTPVWSEATAITARAVMPSQLQLGAGIREVMV